MLAGRRRLAKRVSWRLPARMLQPPSARLFDVLGNTMRRIVLSRLLKRPQSVGELAKGLPISRPAVSQHLAALAKAGLVTADTDGWTRVYRAEVKALKPIRDWLDEVGA
jgi:DNA-binding transcriptional ArsR family regulator